MNNRSFVNIELPSDDIGQSRFLGRVACVLIVSKHCEDLSDTSQSGDEGRGLSETRLAHADASRVVSVTFTCM